MKICNKCEKELPGFMFSKCSRNIDGLDNRCRICKSGKKQPNQKKHVSNKKSGCGTAHKTRFGRKRLLTPYIKMLLERNGFDKQTIERYPQLITIKRLQLKTLRTLKIIDNDNEG